MSEITKEQLLQRAEEISQETLPLANTAPRVGSLMRDIVEFLTQDKKPFVPLQIRKRTKVLPPTPENDNVALTVCTIYTVSLPSLVQRALEEGEIMLRFFVYKNGSYRPFFAHSGESVTNARRLRTKGESGKNPPPGFVSINAARTAYFTFPIETKVDSPVTRLETNINNLSVRSEFSKIRKFPYGYSGQYFIGKRIAKRQYRDPRAPFYFLNSSAINSANTPYSSTMIAPQYLPRRTGTYNLAVALVIDKRVISNFVRVRAYIKSDITPDMLYREIIIH